MFGCYKKNDDLYYYNYKSEPLINKEFVIIYIQLDDSKRRKNNNIHFIIKVKIT